ncbi:hypothetical protein IEQ34_018910 [Dendrobium chrysotoxum]|uniref:Uncharacterized protein n=1 Tax=Dendrobium chrysotoxum TaxID=161865 RepID=A0AAV7G5Z8_DENCH|nr:hypothetical protein IEQ34_018910 [Dendrobium chrysotoxum]
MLATIKRPLYWNIEWPKLVVVLAAFTMKAMTSTLLGDIRRAPTPAPTPAPAPLNQNKYMAHRVLKGILSNKSGAKLSLCNTDVAHLKDIYVNDNTRMELPSSPLFKLQEELILIFEPKISQGAKQAIHGQSKGAEQESKISQGAKQAIHGQSKGAEQRNISILITPNFIHKERAISEDSYTSYTSRCPQLGTKRIIGKCLSTFLHLKSSQNLNPSSQTWLPSPKSTLTVSLSLPRSSASCPRIPARAIYCPAPLGGFHQLSSNFVAPTSAAQVSAHPAGCCPAVFSQVNCCSGCRNNPTRCLGYSGYCPVAVLRISGHKGCCSTVPAANKRGLSLREGLILAKVEDNVESPIRLAVESPIQEQEFYECKKQQVSQDLFECKRLANK